MDLVSSVKDKLAYFRIKELKDVLNQLSLPKQGKKQDLVDRILVVLSEEGPRWGKKNSIGKEAVAKIIDDTYRKMQVHGASELASRSHSGSDLNHIRPKEEVDDSCQLDPKVRCLCGSSLLTESMIQCEDPQCQVWQHISCVIIPEKPMEGASPEVPSHFYCELCRLKRADPFWVTTGHPLFPVKFTSSGITSDGSTVLHSVEKTFQLSRVDKETLQRTEYDLQIWCMLLNDKVQFRMQWPQYADLQVNGIPVRVVARPGSQLLGINGRDDGSVITTCSREGINKICLSCCDARAFCFGIRIARRQTVQQVLSFIPKEADGENFEDALARVRRCVGGGDATENADSDSDLEVVADSVTLNLRCPMSGSRIRIAGRFKPCIHMGCFDLETFVEMNQRSRKWQCPVCLKNYTLESIIIDPYFNRITSLLRYSGEDISEVEVKSDGTWRVKNETEARELSQWHLPDGSICNSKQDVKPAIENVNQFKLEGTSEGHTGLRLGIRKNRNGIWEVSKPDDKKASLSGNNIANNVDYRGPNILPMSSSPTGSYRDGEDPSVNQEGGMHFDLSLTNGHEFNSLPLKFGHVDNVEDRQPQQLKDQDVIILSDSDEDNITMVSAGVPYNPGTANGTGFPFSTNNSGFSEKYPEDPGLGTSGTSCLGLFNSSGDDFEMNPWPMQNCSQPGRGFQFFGSDHDIPDAIVDTHNSFGIAPTNGYALNCNAEAEETSIAQDISNIRTSTEMQASLVDNPLAFGGEDPSLQIFLPTRPSGVPLQNELTERDDLPNEVHLDDWISLTLAAGGGHEESAPSVALNSQPQIPPKEPRLEPLSDAASALLSMNDDSPTRPNSSQRRLENIFSHPRQPRSVRPRLCLSIDTDSE